MASPSYLSELESESESFIKDHTTNGRQNLLSVQHVKAQSHVSAIHTAHNTEMNKHDRENCTEMVLWDWLHRC